MDLKIKHETGEWTVHMDAFFPTSKTRFRKLLKIITLDSDYDKHVETMGQYFRERLKEVELQAKKAANDYSHLRTKLSELEYKLERAKDREGNPLRSEAQWREARRVHRDLKKEVRCALSWANGRIAQKEQFEEHIKQLERVK